MACLVDTNVLSELRKRERADAGVLAWFAGTNESDLFTSVLVTGEIRRGIESVRRRDEVAALALEQWLLRTLETFGDRILPVDAQICDRWGRLNVPDPVPAVDGLLAATALEHDLLLVTRNTKDVAPTGVRALNPFSAAT
ncbi:MAG: type II toxin-antitoxin system VapC family toxin [Actinobacteria bacterium]|nr:MAG: type II toxin-antitoxin system VapC family toxin [Actinomycetota bacterium]